MANNIQLVDANGAVQTVSTTQVSGVHTPHQIIDSGSITIFFGAPQHVIVDSAPSSVISGTVTVVQATPANLAATVSQGTSPWVVSNGGTFAVQEATLDGAISGGKVKVSSAVGDVIVEVSDGTNVVLSSAHPGFVQFGSAQHVIVDSLTPGSLSALIINATGAKTLVKGSAGQLFGMFFLNNTATPSWIVFFNKATTGAVTLGVDTPDWAAPIAANGTLYIAPGDLAQKNFTLGIVYAATDSLVSSTTESMSGTIEYL